MKNVFSYISRNSQKNTCAEVSFNKSLLALLKRDSSRDVFPRYLRDLLEHPLYNMIIVCYTK